MTPPEDETPRELISDPRAMRALAHPLRVALLEAVRRDGQITASHAAELFDESPGNMSWHLQTLARYGFIEEAGGGRGRSRPWKVRSVRQRFDSALDAPGAAAAGEALERTFVERVQEQLREWWAGRHEYSVAWRRAAFMSQTFTYLTEAELAALSDEVTAIFGRYLERDQREKRPDDALPVQLFALGHPVPPTRSGN